MLVVFIFILIKLTMARDDLEEKPPKLVENPSFTDSDVAAFRDMWSRDVTDWYKNSANKLNIYSISSLGSGSLVSLSNSVVQSTQLQEIQQGFCNYCGSAFRPDEYECCKCGAPKERK